MAHAITNVDSYQDVGKIQEMNKNESNQETEIQIEKGVPIPEYDITNRAKYPIKQMAVGDSFIAPSKDLTITRQALYQSSKRNGFKLLTRKVEGGIRVWRIA